MCRKEIPHRTYTADEWRNQGHISLSTCNSLAETEQQGQVGADLVITLKLSCGLDALPGRSNLDKDTIPCNTNTFVEGNELLSLVDQIRHSRRNTV